MGHDKMANGSDGVREWANWTQASLFTVGNSLKSAGSTLVTGIKAGYDHVTADHTEKETILDVRFGYLELLRQGEEKRCPVLVLVYPLGFQVWSVEDNTIREVASRREGTVRCAECIPLPLKSERSKCNLLQHWPLLAVCLEVRHNPVNSVALDDDSWTSCQVALYSLQRHSYVHNISVPGCVLKIACSPRVLLVAMNAQIMAYDICTFEVKFSTVTYPAPPRAVGGDEIGQSSIVPLALGSRWLAHASNQAVQTASGIAISHNLGNGISSTARGSHLETVQHYAGHAAKTSGRHLKTLGEASYKYLANQVDSWRGNASSAPTSPSSVSSGSREDSDVVGTVVVRDVVSRRTIAHFRAHTSPLSLLQFDSSGTLLVTASIHGHTINIFHISPAAGSGERMGSATHLYKLSRGMTPALIQTVAFSADGHWLCASSARGTTHIFHLGSQAAESELPLHLAAGKHSETERGSMRAVKLNAIGRARSASLLNGSIPGTSVANAAVGLYSGSPGTYLVASLFAPQLDEPDGDAAVGLEDLWVAANDGQLFRHRLSLQTPVPKANGLHSSPSTGKADIRLEPNGVSTRELVVEAVQRFDICRRHTWPEREEQLLDSTDSSPSASAHGQPAWASFAETSVPGASTSPLWADPQFHILEMQTSATNTDVSQTSSAKTLSQAFKHEEIPTKRIDNQDRESLAPVIIEGAETAVLRGVQMRVDTRFPSR